MKMEKLRVHIEAHKHCRKNRKEISDSDFCGCFYCLDIYPSEDVKSWCDKKGPTALCPKCGIDSVIGTASGFLVTKDLLEKMQKYWF